MDEKTAQLLRRMASQSAIDARFSVLPDFSQIPQDWAGLQKTGSGFSAGGMEGRMNLYFQHVLPLSRKALAGLEFQAEEITHLLAVSCTGIAAPGLDLMLCEALNLNPETQRSCIHFMGCYAAIHALKQADFICRAQADARVLIVCTELCTLHIRADLRPDNLASTLLFGDGAAAVLLCGEASARSKPMFRLRNFASVFLPSGKNEMAWHPDEEGFRMELGRFVPDLIGQGISQLLQRATISAHAPSGWAIHPGGRKILDKVAEGLTIEKSALASSFTVLKNFGNMSSPTVLFVLEKEFHRMAREGITGTVFSAAFGPGLTMESMLLETC
jgi:predicted naringenin-chalcone synthase